MTTYSRSIQPTTSAALASARTVAGSEVVSLSDETTLAFLNLAGLQASSLVSVPPTVP